MSLLAFRVTHCQSQEMCVCVGAVAENAPFPIVGSDNRRWRIFIPLNFCNLELEAQTS